ncbi:MAG: precorrin-6y C5,15-methyltransferase (decarboxylating) subunit CbiE [Desulfonatronovibrionaceae bacterium]
MAQTITIIGCGPGAAEYVTPAAVQAVQEAELVMGPEKLTRLFDLPREKLVFPDKSLDQTLNRMARLRQKHQLAVLVSGDPGCFSLAAPVVKRFGPESCRIIPGISSVQLAMARLGLSWAQASMVSIHGRPDQELDKFLHLPCPLVILLGTDTVPVLPHLDTLLEKGSAYLLQNLGLAEERIVQITCPEDLEPQLSGSALLVVV